MTINSTTRKTNALVGNGNTATYPFAFKVFTDADVVVKKLETATSIETTLTLGLNNDYIVTLNEDQNSNPGGSITLKSGGNNQNLASGFSIVITSAVEPLQGTDLTNQGGFFPEVINDALDKAIVLHQQQQDELNRSIKFSLTNTIGSLEITENANARKNRVLGFDNAGEFEVLKELGTYRGDWAAGRDYAVRDLVKDTSTNNIFFCNTAHTSSGAQPLTTNTNSANWDLIVDAASATSAISTAQGHANAAATSATAAANSASGVASSATAAANSATTASTKASEAATSATNAANSATTATTQASNASTSATNAAASAAAAAASASGAGATSFAALTDTPANFSGAGGKTVKVNSSANALEFVDQISDVVGDSSPQLGGNLDLQAFELNTSQSNANIKLNPTGFGAVEVKGGGVYNGKLQLNCSQNSHGVKIKSPPHSANASYTLTLPNNDGDAGQFLKTDGSGVLSFDTVSQPDSDKITEGNTEAEVVDTGSDGHFKVTTEGTERFRVIADGKVGIGTSTPGELLQIYDASGNPTINVRANNQNTASLKLENDDGDWTISSGTSSYPLNFAVGGSNKLTILNDGKVGIGDTTPSTELEVNGTVTATAFAGSGANLTGILGGIVGFKHVRNTSTTSLNTTSFTTIFSISYTPQDGANNNVYVFVSGQFEQDDQDGQKAEFKISCSGQHTTDIVGSEQKVGTDQNQQSNSSICTFLNDTNISNNNAITYNFQAKTTSSQSDFRPKTSLCLTVIEVASGVDQS